MVRKKSQWVSGWRTYIQSSWRVLAEPFSCFQDHELWQTLSRPIVQDTLSFQSTNNHINDLQMRQHLFHNSHQLREKMQLTVRYSSFTPESSSPRGTTIFSTLRSWEYILMSADSSVRSSMWEMSRALTTCCTAWKQTHFHVQTWSY